MEPAEGRGPAEARAEHAPAGPQVAGLGEPRPEPERALARGDRPPQLVLPDLAGVEHDLGEYAGRVVVLNVWGSWCVPCVRELPSLQRLHEADRPGISVVTISVDEYSSVTESFIERTGLTAPVWHDPDGLKVATWGTVRYPETWILDREGRVAERVLGARDWSSEAMIAHLADI